MTNTHDNKKSETIVSRRRVLLAMGSIAIVGSGAALLMSSKPAIADDVVVYKDPSCGCCGRWVEHMQQNGFTVDVINVDDMDPIKRKAGVSGAIASCHTAFIGEYVVEGHVPASDIKRMLSERPTIKGLTVPGMPLSAPGMDSPGEPFEVLAFDNKGNTNTYASY